MEAFVGLVVGLVALAVVLGLYFAPAIIAGVRHHRQLGPIIAIDLLAGWTVIGWVVALAMSLSATRPPTAQTVMVSPAWPEAPR